MFKFFKNKKQKAAETISQDSKKQKTNSESWEKILLKQLLSDKPYDTKQKVSNAFNSVKFNFEFAVSVEMSKAQERMDESSDRSFIVWGNQDETSTIIYGAGNIYQNSFTNTIDWLKSIGIKSEVILIHFEGRDGDKILSIQN